MIDRGSVFSAVALSALAWATSGAAQTSGSQAPLLKQTSTTYEAPVATNDQAPASQAQPPSSPAAGTVDEIVVTAQKRSQNVDDVPLSITAVSGQTLLQRGIRDVQDLTKVTPGLSYVESGPGVPVYSLRGVGFFDTSIGARPTVSVYVDEAPLPFSIETTAASLDLDQVEVLKGPQGTLFGSNSTGGAINYIAAKPKDTFGAGFTGSYGSYNEGDVQGYVTGPIAPGLDARLALRTLQSDGWQESYTRSDHLGGKNLNEGRLLLDWKPDGRLKISINLNGYIDRSDTQAGQFIAFVPQVPSKVGFTPGLASYPVAPANDRAADWDANTPLHRDNQFYQGVLRLDYRLDDHLTLTSLTAYSKLDLHQAIDVDGTALENALEHVSGRVSSASSELRVTGTYAKLTTIVGANFSHDTSLERDFYNVPYSTVSQEDGALAAVDPLDALEPYGQQTFNTTAAFANFDYSVLPQVRLHGGVRFTQANLGYDTCTRAGDAALGTGIAAIFSSIRAGMGLPPLAPIPAGSCYSLNSSFTPAELTGNFDQNNVSWRVGADYKPREHVLLYVSVSRGYKAGSVPITGTTSNIEATPVNQESVLAYEVGAKLSTLNRKLDFTGALFDYEYTDKQLLGRVETTPNVFGPLQALVNVPESRIRGAEAQLSLHPVNALTLSAAATYINSEVIGTFNNYTLLGEFQNFRGESFPYTPRIQANLDADYDHPLTETLLGTVGVDFAYRSSTTGGFGSDPLLDIKSYGILDFQIGIENHSQGWRLAAFGRNVTDAYYWTNVAKYFDDVRRLAGRPATFGVQASQKF